MQINLKGLGDRLKEVRERLGLSQHSFGQVGGINRMTQGRYESGVNHPGVDYLYLLQQSGVDVTYVLTGTAEAEISIVYSAEELAKVMAWVDDLSAKHNIPLSPHERVQTSLRLYRKLVKGELKEAPSLSEFVRVSDE